MWDVGAILGSPIVWNPHSAWYRVLPNELKIKEQWVRLTQLMADK